MRSACWVTAPGSRVKVTPACISLTRPGTGLSRQGAGQFPTTPPIRGNRDRIGAGWSGHCQAFRVR